MFWLINALKAGKIKSVGQAIRAFTNVNGRAPSGVERLRIGQIFENTKAKVLPFKYKKSFKQEIEEMTPGEVIPKETSLTKDEFFRIKQGLSTKIKLNTLGENKQLAKELVSGKNSEFNTLDKAAKREVLNRLEISIKNAKADFATPVKPKDLASGGRIGMFAGLIAKGAKAGKAGQGHPGGTERHSYHQGSYAAADPPTSWARIRAQCQR